MFSIRNSNFTVGKWGEFNKLRFLFLIRRTCGMFSVLLRGTRAQCMFLYTFRSAYMCITPNISIGNMGGIVLKIAGDVVRQNYIGAWFMLQYVFYKNVLSQSSYTYSMWMTTEQENSSVCHLGTKHTWGIRGYWVIHCCNDNKLTGNGKPLFLCSHS